MSGILGAQTVADPYLAIFSFFLFASNAPTLPLSSQCISVLHNQVSLSRCVGDAR